MGKILSEAFKETKKLPKGLLLAAIIVPGGIATIAVYIAGKGLYQTLTQKGKKNDFGKNNKR